MKAILFSFVVAIFLIRDTSSSESAGRSNNCHNFDQCRFGEKLFRTCSCKADCHKFRDCCSDNDGFLQMNVEKPQNQQYQCKSDRYLTPVYAKKTCLGEFIAHLSNKHACEEAIEDRADVLGNILVTSLKTKVTYWNKHCFLCNNEDIDDLRMWTTQISCPAKHGDKKFSSSYIEKHLTYDKDYGEWGLKVEDGFAVCSLGFHKPRHVMPKYLDYCAPNLVSTCPPEFSDEDVIEKCSMYHAERKLKNADVYFRNVYCALCHGVSEEGLSCVGRNYGPTPQKSGKDILKVMFDGEWLEREGAEKYKCSTNNTWDPFLERCRPIPGRILRDMYATSPVSSAEIVSRQICVLAALGLFLFAKQHIEFSLVK